MTTYFYGMVPPTDPEGEGPEDKIICLSAKGMLASLVYTNTPEGFTLEDVRQILGDAHFEDQLEEGEEFDGSRVFSNDDLYYQYPQLVMLSDLPGVIQELGEEHFGRVDSWLVIPASREKELVEVARQHQFDLIRDDNLALAVDLFTSDSNRLDRPEFDATVKRLKGFTTPA